MGNFARSCRWLRPVGVVSTLHSRRANAFDRFVHRAKSRAPMWSIASAKTDALYHRTPRLVWLGMVVMFVAALLPAMAAPASATSGGVISNHRSPSISDPEGITTGSDGNLWFTDVGNNSIGRITPSGAVTEFQRSPDQQPSFDRIGPRWSAVVHKPELVSGDPWVDWKDHDLRKDNDFRVPQHHEPGLDDGRP